MIAESSKAFIFQKFAVKFCFGLSLHIFQHDSSLSLENVCDSWCMHQTGFSSAAVVPQSKFTELCSMAAVVSQSNLPSCVARQPLCHKVNLPRCEVNLSSCFARQPFCRKVNLPRCDARRRHLIMTCDILAPDKRINTLTPCHLSGKTYKPAHSSASRVTEINTLDQIAGKVIDVSRTHIPLKALTGLVRSLNSDVKALKTVNSM